MSANPEEGRTELGLAIEQGLSEVAAWRRGEIALETRVVDPMPPEEIKALRKRHARSPREFERRFGVPARTLEGWEQGHRKPDLTARILLRVIDREPEAVERAVR